jgi:hypothetical protein
MNIHSGDRRKEDYSRNGYVLELRGEQKCCQIFKIKLRGRGIGYQAFLGEHAIGRPYASLSGLRAFISKVG